MNQIKNILNWFYERTALWIILFMGITFMSGISDLSIQSSKIKKGTLQNAKYLVTLYLLSTYKAIKNIHAGATKIKKD